MTPFCCATAHFSSKDRFLVELKWQSFLLWVGPLLALTPLQAWCLETNHAFSPWLCHWVTQGVWWWLLAWVSRNYSGGCYVKTEARKQPYLARILLNLLLNNWLDGEDKLYLMLSYLIFNNKILNNMTCPEEQATVLLLEIWNYYVYLNWTRF